MKVSELLAEAIFPGKRGKQMAMRAHLSRNHWVIRPAGRDLFDKNRVSMEEIAGEWDDGTVLVVEFTGTGKKAFICGGMKAKVGDTNETKHDQHGNDLGEVKVLNVIKFKDGITDHAKITGENEVGLKDKLALYVFK